MKFFLLVLALAVSVQARNVRDVLHAEGDHDHHHHDHHDHGDSEAAASKGYGRDQPEKPLTVTLVEPTPEPAKQIGYPREVPANPLRIEAQAANEVEVVVEAENPPPQQMMMMGGEIPGTAGVDYPVYDTVPETSFKCEDQQTGGYYADEEGRCQVFHVCHSSFKSSFLCPNGTIFNQKVFVCDWWFNVDCAASKDSYGLNAAIGVVPEKEPETEPVVAASNTVDSPALEYLPPAEPEAPAQEYLPPATAVEAIANGILASAPVVVETPGQSYLPPDA